MSCCSSGRARRGRGCRPGAGSSCPVLLHAAAHEPADDHRLLILDDELSLRRSLRERYGAERADRLQPGRIADLLGDLEAHLVGVVEVRHDLHLGADVLPRRRPEPASKRTKRTERAGRRTRRPAGEARDAAEAAEVRLQRDVLPDVDLGGDVVGREDVRRGEDVGVVRRREGVDEDAERRDRDARAEEVLATRTARARERRARTR